MTPSKTLSDESVCILSFAKECQYVQVYRRLRMVSLCWLWRRPSKHGIKH